MTWAPARHYVPATGLTRCNLLALPGKVSLNTYIITLLTTHPDRKKVKSRAKKGK